MEKNCHVKTGIHEYFCSDQINGMYISLRAAINKENADAGSWDIIYVVTGRERFNYSSLRSISCLRRTRIF